MSASPISIAELKRKARDRGIIGFSKMSKNDLMFALGIAHRAGAHQDDLNTPAANVQLIRAAREGITGRVRRWIENGARDLDGAMAEAAMFGQVNVVKMLIRDFNVSADIALLAVAGSTLATKLFIAKDQFDRVDANALKNVTAGQVTVALMCAKLTTNLAQAIRRALNSSNEAVYLALTSTQFQ